MISIWAFRAAIRSHARRDLAVLSRMAKTLREMERGAQAGPGKELADVITAFDTLRTEPRFQEIVRQVETHRQEVREGIRQMETMVTLASTHEALCRSFSGEGSVCGWGPREGTRNILPAGRLAG